MHTAPREPDSKRRALRRAALLLVAALTIAVLLKLPAQPPFNSSWRRALDALVHAIRG